MSNPGNPVRRNTDGVTLRYLFNKLKKHVQEYNKDKRIAATIGIAITENLEIIAHYERISKQQIPGLLRQIAEKIESESVVVEEH